MAGVSPHRQARSSAVEHLLDTQVVGGSIPLAPTKPKPQYWERSGLFWRRWIGRVTPGLVLSPLKCISRPI